MSSQLDKFGKTSFLFIAFNTTVAHVFSVCTDKSARYTKESATQRGRNQSVENVTRYAVDSEMNARHRRTYQLHLPPAATGFEKRSRRKVWSPVKSFDYLYARLINFATIDITIKSLRVYAGASIMREIIQQLAV